MKIHRKLSRNYSAPPLFDGPTPTPQERIHAALDKFAEMSRLRDDPAFRHSPVSVACSLADARAALAELTANLLPIRRESAPD
jgi:hypothetical protein